MGWSMGRGVRSPADWERRELPQRVSGGAPSAIAFSAYFRTQNASDSKKTYDSLAQSIRKWYFYMKICILVLRGTCSLGILKARFLH